MFKSTIALLCLFGSGAVFGQALDGVCTTRCDAGLVCSAGRCRYGILGESCSLVPATGAAPACAAGLTCIAGTCQAGTASASAASSAAVTTLRTDTASTRSTAAVTTDAVLTLTATTTSTGIPIPTLPGSVVSISIAPAPLPSVTSSFIPRATVAANGTNSALAVTTPGSSASFALAVITLFVSIAPAFAFM